MVKIGENIHVEIHIKFYVRIVKPLLYLLIFQYVNNYKKEIILTRLYFSLFDTDRDEVILMTNTYHPKEKIQVSLQNWLVFSGISFLT